MSDQTGQAESTMMQEEYKYLHQLMQNNERFIIARPFIIITTALIGVSKIEMNFLLLILIPIILLKILQYNLKLTIHRMDQNSRISAYLQLVHERPKRFGWVGWERSLYAYYEWCQSHTKDTDQFIGIIKDNEVKYSKLAGKGTFPKFIKGIVKLHLEAGTITSIIAITLAYYCFLSPMEFLKTLNFQDVNWIGYIPGTLLLTLITIIDFFSIVDYRHELSKLMTRNNYCSTKFNLLVWNKTLPSLERCPIEIENIALLSVITKIEKID